MDLIISSFSSNSGKTLLTTALLNHYKNQVRPYKIGPDFIDIQFHKKICGVDSINLDLFMMNEIQVSWIYNYYKKKINIIEGVMGFYDGIEKGVSTYNIAKTLKIPVVLVIDGSGSYSTISALIKGMLEYKKDNQIKGIILNKISSINHYNLIKSQIKADHKDLKIFGWIEKEKDLLNHTYLGLDLKELDKIELISKKILKNINLAELENLSSKNNLISTYPFNKIKKINKKTVIVNDECFSFLYKDNLEVLKELFSEVKIISVVKDEIIPINFDFLYIPGGYVEDEYHYNLIKNSNKFKKSLIKFAKTKPIYAECAGLVYLGKKVDEKIMSEILEVEFELRDKKVRLGYFYSCDRLKGHCFHYTKPKSLDNAKCKLSKKINKEGEQGVWTKNKIYASYLHIFFRNNLDFLYKIAI